MVMSCSQISTYNSKLCRKDQKCVIVCATYMYGIRHRNMNKQETIGYRQNAIGLWSFGEPQS